ncbi:MAG: circadian clock protein KaiC, partial [Candidatus Altiarchaeota archaeon]|nr:circadian clock protein KaiC [Candidatus Altiarchaeota archaeon]
MDAEEEIEFEGDDRCPTGIPGLDEVISGGFPRGRTILLTGACGTGKTIFGIQYLFNGITKYNEPGVLVLLEQNIE